MTIEYKGRPVEQVEFRNHRFKSKIIGTLFFGSPVISLELIPEKGSPRTPRDKVMYLKRGKAVSLVGDEINKDLVCKMHGLKWFPSNDEQRRYTERKENIGKH